MSANADVIVYTGELKARISSVKEQSTWSFTLFNDQASGSSQFINTFHLEVSVPFSVTQSPSGWVPETNGSTYVLWHAPDMSAHISPETSLTGFKIQSSSAVPTTIPFTITAWNHNNNLPGMVLIGGATPIPMPLPAPVLLAEEGSQRAVALDSVTRKEGPFTVVTTTPDFSSDHRRRILLFARYLSLMPGEGTSAVTAEAEDPQQQIHPLSVDFVGPVLGQAWLTQLNVKLADSLIGKGDVKVRIVVHGQNSNWVLINIQ